MSNSGRIGSPSSRNEVIVGTPAWDRTSIQLDNLEIQGDEVGSQGPAGKKKRGPRAIGGDKSGRGLCQFSMKVSCFSSFPCMFFCCVLFTHVQGCPYGDCALGYNFQHYFYVLIITFCIW